MNESKVIRLKWNLKKVRVSVLHFCLKLTEEYVEIMSPFGNNLFSWNWKLFLKVLKIKLKGNWNNTIRLINNIKKKLNNSKNKLNNKKFGFLI